VDATKFLTRLLLRGRVELHRDAPSGRMVVAFTGADGSKVTATEEDLGTAVYRLYELVEGSQPKTPSTWSRKPSDR
jgi:hypothetical protein